MSGSAEDWGRRESGSATSGDEDPTTNSRLEAARADAELFLSCVPSILIGLDPDGLVTRWNPAAVAILGVSPERALGRAFEDSGIQWEKPGMKAEVARWLRAAAPSFRSEDVPYRRDQKTRILGLTVRRMVRGQETAGFIVTAADVTEVRALELELRQAQRLEAVGQLAAGLAHEVNTPIQFVCDNLQFLGRAFAAWQVVLAAYEQAWGAASEGMPLDPWQAALARAFDEADVDYLRAEAPKALAQSLAGAEQVAALVRAMKEFAHPGRTEKAAADLNRALQNALLIAQHEINPAADAETDFGELPPVVCHGAEINQVFLNLILNAAQAVRDRMKQTGRRGRISLQTRREGQWVAVRISDTGGGIPEAIRSKVFDPFFTTKPVGSGSGQGLAIARAIVVGKHGGTLNFEPNGMQGTTFVVTLPVSPAPEGPEPADPNS
ncbi:MAG: PAS domain-containing protein [Acidobacteriia bacterium]|nr:PAS domain-containing protein [Terriglobia bacterium]